MAVYSAVYRIVQRYAPLIGLEADADLIPLIGGTIIPSYHSRPTSKDILRFIVEPFRAAQGNTVKSCELFAIASDSCTAEERTEEVEDEG